MNWKLIFTVAMMCAVLCFSMALFTVDAQAQDSTDSKKSDKKIANKKGVGNSLHTADEGDKKPGPTKTQMWLGVGSCGVMWIVVKYL